MEVIKTHGCANSAQIWASWSLSHDWITSFFARRHRVRVTLFPEYVAMATEKVRMTPF
jgi:hypothetical protein